MVERTSLAPGHEICRIINGGWQLSAGHGRDALDRRAVVAGLVRLAEAGLTTFDCADIYTGVEELFGEVRKAYSASGGDSADLQIHTKFVPDRASLTGVDRGYVTRIVDRSLRRLGVERLDLVQFHWWDYEIPGCIEAAGILSELRDAGKICSIGVTNFNAGELRKLFNAGIPIVSAQVQYSALDRRPERGLAALCSSRGAKLLCYGSLAGGFLTGRYLSAEDPSSPELLSRDRSSSGSAVEKASALENRSLTKYRLIIEEFGGWNAYQRLLSTMADVARKHRVSVANVAARYVLQKGGVGAVIVGARSDKHLHDTLRTFGFALDGSDLGRLDEAESVRVPGDCFDLERVPDGIHQRIMKMNLNDE